MRKRVLTTKVKSAQCSGKLDSRRKLVCVFLLPVFVFKQCFPVSCEDEKIELNVFLSIQTHCMSKISVTDYWAVQKYGSVYIQGSDNYLPVTHKLIFHCIAINTCWTLNIFIFRATKFRTTATPMKKKKCKFMFHAIYHYHEKLLLVVIAIILSLPLYFV